MGSEFALIDYRRDCHVIVKRLAPKTFMVTLKFFIHLSEEDNSLNKREMLRKWCSKWTSKKVADDFTYEFDVKGHWWVSPGVLRIIIETREEETKKYIHDWFRYDCLEDTMYEGDPENSFWIIPSLKRIYEEQNPTIPNV